MSNFLQNNGPWSQLVDINNIKIKEINFGSSTKELTNIDITPFKFRIEMSILRQQVILLKEKQKSSIYSGY